MIAVQPAMLVSGSSALHLSQFGSLVCPAAATAAPSSRHATELRLRIMFAASRDSKIDGENRIHPVGIPEDSLSEPSFDRFSPRLFSFAALTPCLSSVFP